ncbi:hypothetical protein [Trichloromonas sp.]|uniref:hypothetical protein n=1 Tax=Trichloromonas sp. TaxID=3069249 RepID=UPI002A3DA578|nr:hypothetical protein [Trichloromonas sp.]
MNLVDSCGWLAYFADSPTADIFAQPLGNTEELLVPSIALYGVFKITSHSPRLRHRKQFTNAGEILAAPARLRNHRRHP